MSQSQVPGPFDWHDFVAGSGQTWHDPWSGKEEPACTVCGVGESRAVHHRDQVETGSERRRRGAGPGYVLSQGQDEAGSG